MEQQFYPWMTLNDLVAVQKIESTGVKVQQERGVALMSHNKNLAVTVLVFDTEINDEMYPAGTRVAFSGESQAKPWNSGVLTHEGKSFVLAPAKEIIMYSIPKNEIQPEQK